MKCPKCNESLGLLHKEDAVVGRMFVHRKGWCDAVLIITSVDQISFDVRLATKEELHGAGVAPALPADHLLLAEDARALPASKSMLSIWNGAEKKGGRLEDEVVSAAMLWHGALVIAQADPSNADAKRFLKLSEEALGHAVARLKATR